MKKTLISIVALVVIVVLLFVGGAFKSGKTAGSAAGFTSFTSIEYTGMLQSDGVTSITPSATTTYRMVESDVAPVILFNSASSTATTNLYLPASSSLATLIPSNGSSIKFEIYNATSSATSTMTVTAGTGVTLVKATSSAIVPAGGVADVILFRLSTGNVIATLDINN